MTSTKEIQRKRLEEKLRRECGSLIIKALEDPHVIEIISVLPITDQTWQCEWQETTRNHQGQIKAKARWKASIALAFNPPNEEKQILLNPLGIYVVDINWAQQL